MYEWMPISVWDPEIEEYEEVLSTFGEEEPEDIWDRAVALDFEEEELWAQ